MMKSLLQACVLLKPTYAGTNHTFFLSPETKCIPPFSDSSGLGCFYLHSGGMEFDDARAACQAMSSDLAVPDDVFAFFDWSLGTMTGKYYFCLNFIVVVLAN